MESISTSMRSRQQEKHSSCCDSLEPVTCMGRGDRAGTSAEPRHKAGDRHEQQGCCYQVSLLLIAHLMEEV